MYADIDPLSSYYDITINFPLLAYSLHCQEYYGLIDIGMGCGYFSLLSYQRSIEGKNTSPAPIGKNPIGPGPS